MNLRTAWQFLRTSIKLFLGKGVTRSYAQNGEDVLIRQAIGGAMGGTYVEVGAFHPVHYSNTYALYKLGWSGLVIDASPDSRMLFRLIRPRDTFVEAAVASAESECTYYRFADPAYNTLSDEYAKRWQDKKVPLISATRVMCRPLAKILANHGISRIDLLSVDAEGFDLSVLKSHDWSIPTKVIVVESHDFNVERPETDAVYVFLKNRGYILVACSGFSLVFKKL